MASDSEAPPNKIKRVKAKVVKDWNEDEVYKLINLVEERVCLWNAADVGYHNKVLRDNAWQSIEEFFGGKFGVADLHAKWTNLRIQFRGYAARAKTKSGQGAEESPKWRFFSAMAFVGRAEDQQTQQTTSNLFVEIDSDSSFIDLSTISMPSPRQAAATTKKRPHAADNHSAAAQIADTMREAVATLRERNQNVTNPNASFANYILSELNTLSDIAAAAVRKRVALYFLESIEEERANFCAY